MVVDHLAGPSALYVVTGGNRFYTSAAEGFIFISGLTVGLVYRRIAEREGLAVAIRRLVARAWTLYVLAVGLTLVILPVSESLGLSWAADAPASSPLQTIWAIFSLHQTFHLVDVLTLYVLLMLGAPLALFLLSEGRTAILLAISWLIWAGYQLFPQQTDLPWPIAGNNLFFLSAWQVLFFTAMVIGYHRKRLEAAIAASWRAPLLLASGLGVVALIFLQGSEQPVLQWLQSALKGTSWSVADLQDGLLAKVDVRPVRILASVVVFGFLFQLASSVWMPLRRSLGWLLLPLGQNALYAYSAHVVLAFILELAGSQGLSVARDPTASAAVQATSILLIWLAVRLRVLYPTRQDQRRWMAAVAPLAVGAVVLFQIAPPSVPTGRPAPASASAPAATSASARLARAFGTPIPTTGDGSPGGMIAAIAPPPAQVAQAASGPTPVPAQPSPAATPVTGPKADAARGTAAEYVGDLRGAFKEVVFHSAALGRDISYYVYLPPGYDSSPDLRYPVLYMLHGAGGSKDEWPAYGLVDDVDQMIFAGAIHPLIVVMPQGDQAYWVNWANGGPRWGDYVADDLTAQVDASYRTIPNAAHRAIGGLSMGGAGALQLAFNHPDVFQVAGAHSPSLHLDDGTFSAIYGTGSAFSQREPIDLAANAPGIESLKIWIDMGEDDPWLARDQMLQDNLAARGIADAWSVLPGGHDGDYWIQNLPTYLRFYDSALNGSPAAALS